jgi:hypothetical protein
MTAFKAKAPRRHFYLNFMNAVISYPLRSSETITYIPLFGLAALKLPNLLRPDCPLIISRTLPQHLKQKGQPTPTGEEPPLIWHPVPIFSLRRRFEHQCDHPPNNHRHHCRVCAPVRRLAVPATGGGPDMFWVAVLIPSCRQYLPTEGAEEKG